MFEKAPPQKAPLYLNTPNQNITNPTTPAKTMPAQPPRGELVPATAMATPTARMP
jgi:hypothetical protein